MLYPLLKISTNEKLEWRHAHAVTPPSPTKFWQHLLNFITMTDNNGQILME